MPANLCPGDRPWCVTAASSLLTGSSVAGGPNYPGIESRWNSWTASKGIPPEASVAGSIVPGATSFTVEMPPPAQLAPYFRRTAGAQARLEAYLEATILHELVHSRQTRATATVLPKQPSAQDYIAYYANPFELEAHGAQIAYSLQYAPLPIGVDEIFVSEVGRRIDARIHSLSWSLSFGAAYTEFRHRLAAEVNHCISRLS